MPTEIEKEIDEDVIDVADDDEGDVSPEDALDEEDGAEDGVEAHEPEEDDAPAPAEEGAAPAKTKKGASDVIREIKAENKRLREEREQFAREKIAADAARAERERLTGGQNAELAAARERELLAQMDPIDRLEYQRQRGEDSLREELRRTRLEAADARDYAVFQSKIAADPDLAVYGPEIEQTLANVRAQGGNTTRDAVLAYLVGRDALANKGAKKQKSQEAAARRVRQVSGAAPSARTSTNAARGGGKTLEEKLANVKL